MRAYNRRFQELAALCPGGGGGRVGGVTVPESGNQHHVDTSLPSDDEESGLSVGTEVTGGTTDEAVSSTSSSKGDAVRCGDVDMVL